MLLATTVKATPPEVGVTIDGVGVQVGGAPGPQLRLTELLYPLNAVRVPLNVAELVADADTDGLLITRV